MKKITLILICAFIGSSCASTSTSSSKRPTSPVSSGSSSAGVSRPTNSPAVPAEPEIDYQSIKRLLRMDRDRTQVGLVEKPFNTCQVGFGYPTNQECQNRFLVSLQFQLRCRDSEGTVSEVVRHADLAPVAGESLTWYLKGLQGKIQTDPEGYAEVLTVSSESQRNQRFRLSNEKDFLLMKTQDVKQLMVPQNWCR